MEEKVNIFIRAYSFAQVKLSDMRVSKQRCRELSENEEVGEYKENAFSIIKNGVILLAIFACIAFVGYWLIHWGTMLVVVVTGFLAEHPAVKYLAIAVILMFVIALIFNKKKPETKDKGELEVENEYQQIRSRLFQATLVNSDLGLVTPSNEGELSTPNNINHEVMGNVNVYQYIWKKSQNSEVKINLNTIKRNIMTTFRQFQRDLRMVGTSPHGYLYSGKYYPNILVMTATDNVDYVTLGLAFTDDESCALFENNPYKDKIDTNDKDF